LLFFFSFNDKKKREKGGGWRIGKTLARVPAPQLIEENNRTLHRVQNFRDSVRKFVEY